MLCWILQNQNFWILVVPNSARNNSKVNVPLAGQVPIPEQTVC